MFLALRGKVLCNFSGRSFSICSSFASRGKRPFGGFLIDPGNLPVLLGLAFAGRQFEPEVLGLIRLLLEASLSALRLPPQYLVLAPEFVGLSIGLGALRLHALPIVGEDLLCTSDGAAPKIKEFLGNLGL